MAVSLIEAVGIATIKSFDGGGSSAAEALVNAMCSVGLGGDLNRAAKGIGQLGGIADKGEYASKLDAMIAQSQGDLEAWDKALQNVYNDPGCESSGAIESLMKSRTEKRLNTLIAAKKNI